jgi:Fe-S cluster assembly protein SufD
MNQIVETLDSYLATFERLQRESTIVPQIASLRDLGYTRFSELGFPTTKLESWRFTNVAQIASTEFVLAEPAEVLPSALEPYELHGVDGSQIVVVNGRFDRGLSRQQGLPDGVEVQSIAEAVASDSSAVLSNLGQLANFKDHAFTALNTALISDGVVIRVPAHTIVSTPIHLLFVTTAVTDRMTHPRVLVVAEEGSQVQLVESYVGLGDTRYFTNAVTEIQGGQDAVVDHYKLLRESDKAFHIGSMQVVLARGANFSSHSLTFGGSIVRNDVDAELAGEGVECTLNGLYLANGHRFIDNHTTIRHAKPHCNSHEFYKGILDAQGQAVFNGKIIVSIDAQKTDAKQTNKALLLSDDAKINTKPELEIFADDVKCTHGATIGQLDENALFYLRTRGLTYQQARSVLIHAFASDLLNRVTIESIRVQLDTLLLQQLPGLSGGTFYEKLA